MIRPYFAMGSRRAKKSTAPPPKLKRSTKRTISIFIILVSFLVFLFFILANRMMMPAVVTIANQRSVVIINDAINNSLASTISHFGLESDDLFNKSIDDDGLLTSLYVDTILINQVAAQLAVDISNQLAVNESTPISLPLGMLTGVPMLANLGPNVSINVIPTGEARVDYATSFTQAGINQINFQVWLYIETSMRIVVPLQEEIMPVSRRVPLVNTVFPGTVPEGMLLSNFGLH